MSTAKKLDLISVDDYLAGELTSTVKHEYLGGVVYAMAGARNAHNLIATNLLVALGGRLRGGICRPFNSDTKIRVRLPAAGNKTTQVRFYYPDASVICRPNPQAESYQDEPAILAEVLSRRTRRIDEGEKKEAYLTIPSLAVYLLIEQDAPAVVVFRRGEHGFIREVFHDLNAVLPLPEIAIDLPLAELYESVEFSPEPGEDDVA